MDSTGQGTKPTQARGPNPPRPEDQTHPNQGTKPTQTRGPNLTSPPVLQGEDEELMQAIISMTQQQDPEARADTRIRSGFQRSRPPCDPGVQSRFPTSVKRRTDRRGSTDGQTRLMDRPVHLSYRVWKSYRELPFIFCHHCFRRRAASRVEKKSLY